MKYIRFSIHTGLFVLLLVVVSTPAVAQNCFDCHDRSAFTDKFVHSPVREGDCNLCHNPHVARHEGLLHQAEAQLCQQCHQDQQRQMAENAYLHPPVRQGRCSQCHDPHAAPNAALLPQQGSALCFSCHDEMPRDFKFSHQPFRQGQCSTCHASHGAEDTRLLKKDGTQLCLDCHRTGSAWSRKHLGRKAAEMDCLSCHHPHGSDSRLMQRAVQHEPFSQKQCSNCHDRDTQSSDVCLGCHQDTLPSFNHIHSHLGIAGAGNACTTCHNPHTGDRQGLLPANVGNVCRDCHSATFDTRDRMLHKHPGWNNCTDCHDLHGADNPGMLKNEGNACADCHKRHAAFSHPMGDKAPDPRDGRPMTCETCHDANTGTMYQHFLRGSGERGLCIQCHQDY